MSLPVPRARRRAPRWIADTRGTTAVEFALVCVPFLALIGAIVQIAYMTWAQENLDYTFQTASRAILTGQFQLDNAQTSDPTVVLAALRDSMCGAKSPNTATVYDCSGVKLDIRLGNDFASVAPTTPVDASSGTWSASFGTNYQCAPPNSIVIATAAVEFPVFFSLWSVGLSAFADGGALLQSTAVFRTEPYALPGSKAC